jgi:hypothetical protein
MKKRIPGFILALCFFSLPVKAQESASPEAEAFFQKAMTQINPKHIAWVKSTAKNANEKNLTETEVRNQATQYGVLGAMGNMDIEALAFLVMMQAAKSANEDLKSIMNAVKAINVQKKALRDASNKLNEKNITISSVQLDSFKILVNSGPPVQNVNTTMAQTNRTLKKDSLNTRNLQKTNNPVSITELDNVKKTVKNKLDSMSEMGETESLRLRMAMDRLSKFMSTISNLMKKISGTEDGIIKNLK